MSSCPEDLAMTENLRQLQKNAVTCGLLPGMRVKQKAKKPPSEIALVQSGLLFKKKKKIESSICTLYDPVVQYFYILFFFFVRYNWNKTDFIKPITFVQVLDQALVIALQRPAGAEAKDGMKNRDNMILRWVRGIQDSSLEHTSEYIRDLYDSFF